MSDVLSYALLAGVFVVTGLRLLIEKPHKNTELRLPSRQQNQPSENHEHRH